MKTFFVGMMFITLASAQHAQVNQNSIQSLCLLGLAGESIVISDPKGELWSYSLLDRHRL